MPHYTLWRGWRVSVESLITLRCAQRFLIRLTYGQSLTSPSSSGRMSNAKMIFLRRRKLLNVSCLPLFFFRVRPLNSFPPRAISHALVALHLSRIDNLVRKRFVGKGSEEQARMTNMSIKAIGDFFSFPPSATSNARIALGEMKQ